MNAQSDMLGKVMRKILDTPAEMLGVLFDLLDRLTGSEKLLWFENIKKFLRKEPISWVEASESLLRISPSVFFIRTVTEKFITREKFVLDTSRKAKVKISFLGDNFKNWFLDKVEEPKGDHKLRYGILLKNSKDDAIIAELGGEEKAETTLFELFYLMEIQGNGKEGVLLNNGYANIFYIKDVSGVLRAVHVRWDGDGWGVDAYSVEGPSEWREGNQVFSRNSLSN